MDKRKILKGLLSDNPIEIEKAKDQLKRVNFLKVVYKYKGEIVTDEMKSRYKHLVVVTDNDLISDEIN